MKTKTTLAGKARIMAALFALSSAANAQTTSYSLNTIPIAGSNNAVFGQNSMLSNTSLGVQNTAIGWTCMSGNTTGQANTAGGYVSLAANSSGSGNSAFGAKALDQTKGSSNSGFGLKALTSNITGTYNSALGVYADVSSSSFTNATAIGANAVVNASDRVWLGDPVSTVWTTTSFNTSDGRFKRNVDASSVKGLDFINRLRPVTYTFDNRAFTDYITKNMAAEDRKHHLERDFSAADLVVQTGFIAQEVEQAAKDAGYNFSGVHVPNGETDTYGVSYYQFVVPLVKAVQEQQQMIENQKMVNQQLQQQITELQAALNKSSGTTGIAQLDPANNFSMSQNEPNPFTHETVINYAISEQINNAYLAVYDLSGKQITTFAITQKGKSSITLNSEKLAPGIYIYSIIADGKVFDSKRMIVANKQ